MRALAAATLLLFALSAAPAHAAPYVPACGVGVDDFDARGRRFALLVSINEYAAGNPRSTLAGPGNDMERLCRLLVDKHGFDEADVLRLHGPAASHAGILAGLDALAERSATGRLLLFAYAGHGSYVDDDQDDEEPDGRDETLCPWDSHVAGDLRDDTLHGKLDAILAGGGHLVTIFDSCHSGSATRGDGPSPFGDDVAIRAADPSAVGAPSASGRDGGGSLTGGLAQHERMVLISAAADHEYAKEMRVEVDGGEPKPHGAFSHALLSALEAARPGAAWEEILERARSGVPRRGGRQTPQFVGNLRLQAFGTQAVTEDPHFSVSGVESDGALIKVKAGEAHGVEMGALLSVYGRGTRQLRGSEGLAGVFRVTWTGPRSVRAERLPEPEPTGGATPRVRPKVRSGCPVALLVPAGAFAARRVHLDASLSEAFREALAAELAYVPLIEAAPEGSTPTGDDLVVLLEPAPRGCVVVEGGPAPWPAAPSSDAIGACVMDDPWEGSHDQRPADVLAALGRIAAWERVAAIRHDADGFVGDELLEVIPQRTVQRGGSWADSEPRPVDPETGETVFAPGDAMVVRYRSRLTEGQLYVTVLYLSSDGFIFHLNPSSWSQPLRPGGEVRLDGDRQIGFGPPCGVDRVKLFVTERRPFDPAPLIQQGPPTLSGHRGDGDLQWWIEPLLLGSHRGGAPGASSHDARWTTVDVPLHIRGCAD
jgi:metacaspase-1